MPHGRGARQTHTTAVAVTAGATRTDCPAPWQHRAVVSTPGRTWWRRTIARHCQHRLASGMPVARFEKLGYRRGVGTCWLGSRTGATMSPSIQPFQGAFPLNTRENSDRLERRREAPESRGPRLRCATLGLTGARSTLGRAHPEARPQVAPLMGRARRANCRARARTRARGSG